MCVECRLRAEYLVNHRTVADELDAPLSTETVKLVEERGFADGEEAADEHWSAWYVKNVVGPRAEIEKLLRHAGEELDKHTKTGFNNARQMIADAYRLLTKIPAEPEAAG